MKKALLVFLTLLLTAALLNGCTASEAPKESTASTISTGASVENDAAGYISEEIFDETAVETHAAAAEETTPIQRTESTETSPTSTSNEADFSDQTNLTDSISGNGNVGSEIFD